MPKSDGIWVPLRTEDVKPETLKVVDTVLDKIPKLPVSVRKIMSLESQENTDIKEIAKIVSTDPVLTSTILRAVNSTYYGLSHKTDNINLAIVLLGFKELKNIIMRNSFSSFLGNAGSFEGYETRNLWTHSYLVSVSAESFGDEDNPKHKGVLSTVGVLHDIGKYALCTIAMLLKKKGKKIKNLESFPLESSTLEREEYLFGINHTIMGGMLANKWNLSEKISTTIEKHHYPSYFGVKEINEEYIEDISLICISDLIVNHFTGTESYIPEPHKHFFDIIGFSPPIENTLSPELNTKLEKAKEFLNMIG